MRFDQIRRLYLSHFLTGLVFWYGIEKLFMSSIGIDASGIGIAFAVLMVVSLLLDIPMGVLADKWSRKGVLGISIVALGLSSLVMGFSSNFAMYVFGYILYGIYHASSNGTYQSLTYDTLHEQGKSKIYARMNGRMYAVFLVGAAIGNISSGFLSHSLGYRATFMLTVVSCIFNLLVVFTLRNPTYHKPEHAERTITQLGSVVKALSKNVYVRNLALVVILLMSVRIFMDEFGQLYMVRYVSDDRIIGLLWAIFATLAAFGSFMAHRWQTKISYVLMLGVIPVVIMSMIDSKIGLAFFMVHILFYYTLLVQADAVIQHNTPSYVRTSVASVVTALSGVVAVIASLTIGFLSREYGILWSLRFVTAIAICIAIFWVLQLTIVHERNSKIDRTF